MTRELLVNVEFIQLRVLIPQLKLIRPIDISVAVVIRVVHGGRYVSAYGQRLLRISSQTNDNVGITGGLFADPVHDQLLMRVV